MFLVSDVIKQKKKHNRILNNMILYRFIMNCTVDVALLERSSHFVLILSCNIDLIHKAADFKSALVSKILRLIPSHIM